MIHTQGATDEDVSFLYQVYKETREEELEVKGFIYVTGNDIWWRWSNKFWFAGSARTTFGSYKQFHRSWRQRWCGDSYADNLTVSSTYLFGKCNVDSRD